jgi:hypothetical protein
VACHDGVAGSATAGLAQARPRGPVRALGGRAAQRRRRIAASAIHLRDGHNLIQQLAVLRWGGQIPRQLYRCVLRRLGRVMDSSCTSELAIVTLGYLLLANRNCEVMRPLDRARVTM